MNIYKITFHEYNYATLEYKGIGTLSVNAETKEKAEVNAIKTLQIVSKIAVIKNVKQIDNSKQNL